MCEPHLVLFMHTLLCSKYVAYSDAKVVLACRKRHVFLFNIDMKNRIKNISSRLTNFANSINECDMAAYASSAAFFVFLSLFPVIMLICAILPYTHIEIETLIATVNQLIPEHITSFVDNIFLEANQTSAALISLSALMTLWSAGKGFWALYSGINKVNQVRDNRNTILLRIFSTFYTLIFLLIVIVSLIAMVLGDYILDILRNNLVVFGYSFEKLINGRFIILLFFLTIVFQLMYTFFPNSAIRHNNRMVKKSSEKTEDDYKKLVLFRYQLPGALFSAIMWTLLSYFFSIYVSLFGGFSSYGSLATIVIMFIWLYMNMYIILIGAMINKYSTPFIYKIIKKHHKVKD